MSTKSFKRKLTAIFSADVVGYSRLMGENEAATVKCLEEYKGVKSSLIKQHRGRVIDSPGAVPTKILNTRRVSILTSPFYLTLNVILYYKMDPEVFY
jgi:hypothetical protein